MGVNQHELITQKLECLGAEIETLKNVIKKYGRHLPLCWSERAFDAPCDCGFDRYTGGNKMKENIAGTPKGLFRDKEHYLMFVAAAKKAASAKLFSAGASDHIRGIQESRLVERLHTGDESLEAEGRQNSR